MAEEDSVDGVLSRIYTNPADPGSFRTANALLRRARVLGHTSITREHVIHFLAKQNPHILHRQARGHFSRVQIYAHEIDQQWQAGLADMNKCVDWNENVRYILVVVETLSKSAWAEPCVLKDAKHTTAAFEAVLKRAAPRHPQRLQTDDGRVL